MRQDHKRTIGRPVFVLSIFILTAGLFVCARTASAQSGSTIQLPPPPGAPQNKPYTLKRTVDMVRLPVSVLDKQGNFVNGLGEQDFHVLENGAPQKIDLFTHADMPITAGLVIDNSASMRPKRARVNAAALTFVHTSNPQDEMFVVNFNDEFYLDMDTDFTNDPNVLNAALDRIDSRGGTALYDAILGSMNHLKKGTREKKVLLVITDGEDNDSTHSLAYTVEKLQQSNVMIYAVGLFAKGEDERSEIRQGKKALLALTEASGGEAYFPKTTDEVDAICKRIAEDIRDQYMIGYYPSNTSKDGTFRTVKIAVAPVKGMGKLSVRARPGYFAPKAEADASATAGN